MLIDVQGLPPASDGSLYELWLTKDGELAALCGKFLTDPEGRSVVPMNAPVAPRRVRRLGRRRRGLDDSASYHLTP